MTKSQKIRELELTIENKDRKIAALEKDMALYREKLEAVKNRLDSTPDDCKPGRYCAACEFSIAYHIRDPFYDDVDIIHICTKAGSCKHFVQREGREK